LTASVCEAKSKSTSSGYSSASRTIWAKSNDTACKGVKTQRKGQERAKRSEIERKTKTFWRRILSRLFKKYERRIDFLKNNPLGDNAVL